MFETHNTKRKEIMAVTGMQALERKVLKGSSDRRESGTQVDKGLTVQEAERCLGALVTEGWLEHSREGYYTLSPRALMELRAWLVDMYNDDEEPEEWQAIKFCEACKEIVTVGQRCADGECQCRLHDICSESFWNSRRDRKCPRCNTVWDGRSYVGQKAATKTDDLLREKRRSAVGSRSGSGNRREREMDGGASEEEMDVRPDANAEAEAEDEEEEEDDDEE